MDDIPPDAILSCGCILRCAIVEGVNVLTLIRCKATCINYQNAMKLAEEAELPVEHKEV